MKAAFVVALVFLFALASADKKECPCKCFVSGSFKLRKGRATRQCKRYPVDLCKVGSCKVGRKRGFYCCGKVVPPTEPPTTPPTTPPTEPPTTPPTTPPKPTCPCKCRRGRKARRVARHECKKYPTCAVLSCKFRKHRRGVYCCDKPDDPTPPPPTPSASPSSSPAPPTPPPTPDCPCKCRPGRGGKQRARHECKKYPTCAVLSCKFRKHRRGTYCCDKVPPSSPPSSPPSKPPSPPPSPPASVAPPTPEPKCPCKCRPGLKGKAIAVKECRKYTFCKFSFCKVGHKFGGKCCDKN